MLQLHNARPRSLTPLRPVLAHEMTSPARKRSPIGNKTFLVNHRYKKDKKEELFKKLDDNAKNNSFVLEKKNFDTNLNAIFASKESSFINNETKTPEYFKNDNHFQSKMYFNVPIHVKNISGDINFPSEIPITRHKTPKILRKLPNISSNSPNQRLNTTTIIQNDRYNNTDESFLDKEAKFFTEPGFEDKFSSQAIITEESKNYILDDKLFELTKDTPFHHRSRSIGPFKVLSRKQIQIKKVKLDLLSNTNFADKTSVRFHTPTRHNNNRPGPYRIKFFHEEREKAAREYANFYQIGDNLKKLERTNPIPIHIREYIHKLNNI